MFRLPRYRRCLSISDTGDLALRNHRSRIYDRDYFHRVDFFPSHPISPGNLGESSTIFGLFEAGDNRALAITDSYFWGFRDPVIRYAEQMLRLTGDEPKLGVLPIARSDRRRCGRVYHEVRLRNHLANCHRRGMRDEIIGPGHEFARYDICIAKKLPAAPHLERDQYYRQNAVGKECETKCIKSG